MKRIALLLTLVFAFSLTSLAAESASHTVSDSTSIVRAANHKVVVYYLFVKPRCDACLTIESYSKEAIETGYASELKQGTVEWHAYDTDLPEYEHYWNDYKLDVKSLVISEVKDGKEVRWKICEKVWDLLGDQPEFLKYVQDEVQAYLNNQ